MQHHSCLYPYGKCSTRPSSREDRESALAEEKMRYLSDIPSNVRVRFENRIIGCHHFEKEKSTR